MFGAVILIVAFASRIACAANILAIVPTPSYSHQVAFANLWRELSLRGHNVTVVTTDPVNNKSLHNLREIGMKRSYEVMDRQNRFAKQTQEGFGFWNIWENFMYILSDVTIDMLAQPELQEMIYMKDKFNFDVVMLEFFYPELLAFGKVYNCPTVILGTIGTNIHMQEYLGNPTHPILNSDINVPYAGIFSFKERLISTLFYWNQMYFEYFIFYPYKQKIIDDFFGNVTSRVTIQELIGNIDMMLVNESPLFKGPRALSPTTINVGDGNRLKPLEPLPQELKEYLDSAEDGFIYFSLGGNVKSKDLNNITMNNIMQTFMELPFKVLWKFEAEDLPGKSHNVKLIKWAPQQDILRHPNIKLFIMQGGILSIEEAIFTHVPMIVMPFFGDQLKNARLVENKYIGKCINHKPYLVKEEFKKAILEIVSDKKYYKSIKKLAELMQDQPMTGIELAVWWTEYVIRHKGAKQLRNPVVDIPFYQYYLLDVVGFLGASTFLIIRLSLFVLKKLFQYSQRFTDSPVTAADAKWKKH